MSSSLLRSASILVLVTTACAGVRHVPPPPAPPMERPKSVPFAGSPGQDQGSILIDVDGERAEVTELERSGRAAMRLSTGEMFESRLEVERPVCTAPCVANLSLGTHRLRMRTLDPARVATVDVVATSERSIARVALGAGETVPPLRYVGGTLLIGGVAAAAAGGVLVLVRALTTSSVFESERPAKADFTLPVGLLIGAGVSLLGALIVDHLAPLEFQDGNVTQWRDEETAAKPARSTEPPPVGI